MISRREFNMTVIKIILSMVLMVMMCSINAIGQKKTTSVKGYYRKDGTYVSPHTRSYNAGSGSSETSNYNISSLKSDNNEIHVSDKILGNNRLNPSSFYTTIAGFKVSHSSLVSDTTGISTYIAALRYNDTTLLDLCPIPKSSLTYDYDTEVFGIYFKVHKDKLEPNHTIELVSKYGFQLKDDFLLKYLYPRGGHIDLPPYMKLKFEALILK